MRRRAVIVCFLAWIISQLPGFADDLSNWGKELQQALVDGKGKNLERFFAPDAYKPEMAGWKYNLENGFLDFAGAEIIDLSGSAILLHIPTNNQPYSGANEDAYFDFIYRLYEIKKEGRGFLITRTIGDEVNPDFIQTRSQIEFRPGEAMCLIDSSVTADLKSKHLIFKLAKEFEIEEFRINGQKAPYKRLGYFVYATWVRGNRVLFSLRGKLRAPQDNNQFFSMDQKCFFLRFGGFAAIPSPPPGNDQRYLFSEDRTEFEMTYLFPKDFVTLQYGKVSGERVFGDEMIITASCEGEWMDNIAFYAQTDWALKSIQTGNASLHFYFAEKDRQMLELLTKEIRELLDWSYSVFHAYGESSFNFVVLDRFVENGALNDGHSVIAQNAETHGDDTYIHELLHMVPQPHLKQGSLWEKEGFTNFLSFDFIEFRDGKKQFWKEQQRRFLHCFDQFSEPLSALTSTRMPTYWAAYQKGPWIYRMLASVIGESDFRKAMLEFGKMNGREMGDSREYFRIFEQISAQDLSWFENQWLNRKENPVLRIESRLETFPNGAQVKMKINQEGLIFRLPLEVEIKCEKNDIREIVWIDSAEKEWTVPVQSTPVSVQFDPDAKLFAIIKTGKTSFLNQDKIVLPTNTTTYCFKSDQTGKEIVFQIIPGEEEITFVRKEEGRESVLESSPALSPLKYAVNNAIVYSLNPTSGKIAFADAEYDVAEPVYPEDFVLLLFSCVDWSRSSKESLLFLRSNRKWCAGSYAECEQVSDNLVKLRVDFHTGSLEMSIRDGVAVEFTVDGKEKFVLLK